MERTENMKKVATRTLDELGRINIPKEVREKLGRGEKDKLAMFYADDNTLTLQLEKNGEQ